MKRESFILNFVLTTILLITPSTSLAAIINYSMTSSSADEFYILTPEGSYSADLLGSLWFESEPNIDGGMYLFDIKSFSIVFDIPDLNERLAFTGIGDSTLKLYPFNGDFGLWEGLDLNGTGNFTGLNWYGQTLYNSFNGDLPQSLYISGDQCFVGDGGSDNAAPVLGKDNWTLRCIDSGDVILNRTPVPEPSTFFLLGIGLLATVGFGWKISLSKYNPY